LSYAITCNAHWVYSTGQHPFVFKNSLKKKRKKKEQPQKWHAGVESSESNSMASVEVFIVSGVIWNAVMWS